jgi:hypothetical protein
MPQARSELTGQMVDTSSEAWRHECEVSYMLGLSPGALKTYLEGGEDGRGIIGHRGAAAAEHLKAEMGRLAAARRQAKASV